MSPLGGGASSESQQGKQHHHPDQDHPDVAASSNSPMKDGSHGTEAVTVSSSPAVTTPAPYSGNRRAERKRQREKQRRNELATAFDELSSFVVQLERDHNQHHPGYGNSGYPPDPYNNSLHHHHPAVDTGITRLDLVGRALKMMKLIHEENEHNKRIIASYRLHEMGGHGGGYNHHGHGPPPPRVNVSMQYVSFYLPLFDLRFALTDFCATIHPTCPSSLVL